MKDYYFTVRIKINALRVALCLSFMIGTVATAYVAKVQYKRIEQYNDIIRGNESKLKLLPKPLDVSNYQFEKPRTVMIQTLNYDLPNDWVYTVKTQKVMVGWGYTVMDAKDLTVTLNSPLPIERKQGVRMSFGSYKDRLEPFWVTPTSIQHLLFMDKHLFSRYMTNLRIKGSMPYNELFAFESKHARGLILKYDAGRGVVSYAWLKDTELGQRIIFEFKDKIDMHFIGSFLNSLRR